MLINITINKTLTIYDSVKKIIYAASTYDFVVNIVIMINITINKTNGIYDLLKNYFMLLRGYEYFQCFSIHTSTYNYKISLHR